MVARKRKLQPQSVESAPSSVSASTELDNSETNSVASTTVAGDQPLESKKQFCFKDNKSEANKGTPAVKKQKTWKTLKQIIASERSTQYKPDDPLYSTIDAPPSFKPAKKYSDISGLPALYTDPHTKLRYATAEEYSRVRLLPSDIVSGLLTLRKANTLVP